MKKENAHTAPVFARSAAATSIAAKSARKRGSRILRKSAATADIPGAPKFIISNFFRKKVSLVKSETFLHFHVSFIV